MSEEKKEEFNIKMIRLLSGEDVVADVTVGEEFVNFKNPMTVGLVSGAPGQEPQAVCQPWLLFSTEDNVDVNKDVIVYITNPVESFYKQWMKVFNPSPIIMPDDNKKIVVPDLKVSKK